MYGELFDLLASDHRIVTYHLRGTGNSSRNGPYDMETDIGDLEAVLEATSGPALLIATSDSTNRGARVALRRPELVDALVCFGTPPIGISAFEGYDAMLASDSVRGAFLEMLERSYRGGMRTFLEATNPQMNEDELRERLERQVEFCPQEAALGRLRAWIEDEPHEDARRLGDRLWVFAAAGVAGQWLPPEVELDRLQRELFPEARVEKVEPGPISRPDIAAGLIRKVTSPLQAGGTGTRK